MAKTSNLREFQESILLKLKDATQSTGAESTSRLGVVVGSKNFLMNLGDVKEVLPVPPVLHVPLTKPWFLGVANVRGVLYNISDFAQFMGMAPTHKSMNNRIVLLSAEATSQAALLVDALVGLRSIDAMVVKPKQKGSKHKEDKDYFCSQVYLDKEGNEWFQLDAESLVLNKEFIQPNG